VPHFFKMVDVQIFSDLQRGTMRNRKNANVLRRDIIPVEPPSLIQPLLQHKEELQ
jgi:hypothetical protein